MITGKKGDILLSSQTFESLSHRARSDNRPTNDKRALQSWLTCQVLVNGSFAFCLKRVLIILILYFARLSCLPTLFKFVSFGALPLRQENR
jgi:hypothetical protein